MLVFLLQIAFFYNMNLNYSFCSKWDKTFKLTMHVFDVDKKFLKF